MSYNEQETRFFLIDPVLRDKGYSDHQWLKMETPAPVEPTGPKGRRRKGVGRTDYLLCVQVGDMPKALPVGVLEAKKENEDPLKGMQQAKGYADCQRFEVKYVFATNSHRYGEFDLFTNLLWRLGQAGQLPKPALFLCDRDELRTQAYYKLKAAFGDNARIVETKQGSNAAQNAHIHIATYQTLGLDDDEGFVSFLSEHYGVQSIEARHEDETAPHAVEKGGRE